jgi:CMP-N-acetylneuraminic acid synthetase
MTIVAFVPVKLQSQRLPNKMMLDLGGKPLCQHVFASLLEVQARMPLDIYCYCSDPTIVDVLPPGVRFLQRPAELDKDDVQGMQIYAAFVKAVPADVYALCHATSPFIASDSICDGINSVVSGQHDSAFACAKVQTFCWYKGQPLNYALSDVVRTQDIAPVFFETSAFYVFTQAVIARGVRVGSSPHMVLTDRIESIDIDEACDYELARKVAAHHP